MKKFTLRGVLDGFRSTVGSSSSSGSTSKADTVGVEETIWSEHFQAAKVGVAHYGLIWKSQVSIISLSTR